MNMKEWNELSQYLEQVSFEICRNNGCTEDNHNCGSYAYLDENGNVLDICYPDYFQGHSGNVVSIPLPWNGTGKELKQEFKNGLAELDY